MKALSISWEFPVFAKMKTIEKKISFRIHKNRNPIRFLRNNYQALTIMKREPSIIDPQCLWEENFL